MDKKQLKEIKKGKRNHIDVSIYNKEYYTAEQMEQIRLGLQEGINVSIYANQDFNSEKMLVYRMFLIYNKYFYDDLPIDMLLYDLDGYTCRILFCMIFSKSKKDIQHLTNLEYAKKIKGLAKIQADINRKNI